MTALVSPILSRFRSRPGRSIQETVKHLSRATLTACLSKPPRSGAVQTEPTSWRHYTGLGGETRLIRPDLAAHLTGTDHHGTWDDYWSIEIDMGTESLPSLLAKCHAYTDYYTSGLEQAQHGSFPRVLWLMHGPRAEHRAAELTQRIHRTTRLEPRLFTTATPQELERVLWGEG